MLCRKKKTSEACDSGVFVFLGDPEVFSMEPPSKTNGWKLKIENGLRPKTPKKLLRFPEISFFQKKKN